MFDRPAAEMAGTKRHDADLLRQRRLPASVNARCRYSAPMVSLSSLLRKASRASTPEKALPAIAALRQELEALERHHVGSAVAEGWSWSRVAERLGVSKQAAHKKHSATVRALTVTDPREAVPGNKRVVVTAEARNAVRLGREEARAVGMGVVGTEHLLLGVLRTDPHSAAVCALTDEGITIELARKCLEPTHAEEDEAVSEASRRTAEAARATGVSPLARACLEGSLREAVRRDDRHLGLEHLLLALVSRPDGGAARTLEALGSSPDIVRRRLEQRVGTR
jgi:ATP-dependent Clp protease ATP-binding subunit ClpA